MSELLESLESCGNDLLSLQLNWHASTVAKAIARIAQLEAENAALRADKEQLVEALQRETCRCHYVDRPGSNMAVHPSPNLLPYLHKVVCNRCATIDAARSKA